MPHKLYSLFLFLLLAQLAQGQNLVPNPSFEDTVYCPQNIDSIDACAGWHSGWQPTTSPNYFNTCSSNPQVSPPDVVWGYQQPHSGNAFCYLLTYFNFPPLNRRETIQAALTQALTIGQKYFVSFYLNFPGIGVNNTASNKFGALFTSYPFTPANYAVPHNLAQVYSNTIITDTLNWTHITGSFVADSVYQYITLGNFFDDANTDTAVMFFFGGLYEAGYFIDDICVSTDSLQCYSETGINSNSSEKPIRIFPNPSCTSFSIICPQLIHQIQGYNSLGSMVIDLPDVSSNEITIDCSAWAEGIYFLKINDHLFKQLIIH